MVSHSAICFALPTLTVGVILLRRLRLALRQYNLTLELLELSLELVQLAVRLLHNSRDIRERLAIGRDLPQLLRASLYLQLLQMKKNVKIHNRALERSSSPFQLKTTSYTEKFNCIHLL